MRSISSLTLACGVLLLAHTPLAAQVYGLPVINNGAPTGISVGVEAGFPNAAAGDFTAIGADAAIGVGLVGVRGIVSRVSVKGGDAVWSKGATATLRIFGGPLIPIRAMLLGGWGQWKVGDVSVTHMPLSIGIAATIPNPALAIKPWLAPRAELERTSISGSSHSDTYFAMSGGVDLTLQNGLSFRGAYDRRFTKGANKPGILSLGLGFTL